jgi:hypothetical protein
LAAVGDREGARWGSIGRGLSILVAVLVVLLLVVLVLPAVL